MDDSTVIELQPLNEESSNQITSEDDLERSVNKNRDPIKLRGSNGDLSPKHQSHSDRAWKGFTEVGLWEYLCKRPYLIPVFLIFLFLYCGFINILLYFLFDPPHLRISEVFMLLILSPLSIVFSNAEYKVQ